MVIPFSVAASLQNPCPHRRWTQPIWHHDPSIVILRLNGERLETTTEHSFYVVEVNEWLPLLRNARWVDAADLQVGDDVRRFDGSTGEVQSWQVVQRPQRRITLTYACSSLPVK